MSKATKCRNCLADRKILSKCNECGKSCCTECSINNICIDCYTDTHAKSEVFNYNSDKDSLIMGSCK